MKNYFTISELCKSETADSMHIDNHPDEVAVDNMEKLIVEVLNPLREQWGSPIIVRSGYRCKELNTLVKGSKTSAHLIGAAADIKPQNGKIKELFKLAEKMVQNGSIKVSQLIDEYSYSWIHISCTYEGSKYNQILHLK